MQVPYASPHWKTKTLNYTKARQVKGELPSWLLIDSRIIYLASSDYKYRSYHSKSTEWSTSVHRETYINIYTNGEVGSQYSHQNLIYIRDFYNHMMQLYLTLLLLLVAFASALSQRTAIVVSHTPVNASAVIPESFVSYSIEFSSFPDFAGIYPSLQSLLRLCLDRKSLRSQQILKQPSEQSWVATRNQTIYTSRWQYSRLCTLQFESHLRSWRHCQSGEVSWLSYNHLYWPIIFWVLFNLAQHQIYSWFQSWARS